MIFSRFLKDLRNIRFTVKLTRKSLMTQSDDSYFIKNRQKSQKNRIASYNTTVLIAHTHLSICSTTTRKKRIFLVF
jgi:hypothetical protein